MSVESNDDLTRSASRLVASIWGVLAGLGGFVHGVGEVVQGNVAPSGIVIDSWTQGPIATNMDGEPAMTIVPNLLATGVLTILVSLAVIAWSAGFVQKKHGGRILILLSLGMLLVGGGFGPPLIGILAGWAGTGINSSLTGWYTRLPENVQRFVVKLWPWLFTICLIATVLLVIGSLVLVYFFDVNNAAFFTNIFFVVVLLLPPLVIASFIYDSLSRTHQVVV